VLAASSYPFLDVLWTMLIIFLWIMFFWILIIVLGDIFRRHDISGWSKALWVIFVVFLPFLGILIYLGVNGSGMAERNVKDVQQSRAQTDEYIRSVAGGGPAAEIEKAKALLDSGAISQSEFDALKQKALAGA
jgi:Short C-terminal domain/Phospholipase_D-nuclease N-terminal